MTCYVTGEKTTIKKMNQESVGSDSGFSDQKILLLLMFNPLWDPVRGLGEGWEGGAVQKFSNPSHGQIEIQPFTLTFTHSE